MAIKTLALKYTAEDAILGKWVKSYARAYGWTPKIEGPDGQPIDNPVNARTVVESKMFEHFLDVARGTELDVVQAEARVLKNQEIDAEKATVVVAGELK